MHITIQSFGYDYGSVKAGYKFKADVRNVSSDGIDRSTTGETPETARIILAKSAAKAWLNKMKKDWTPELEDGDKVAIGCAWGVHRSVAIANAYASFLRGKGFQVTVRHRDINKSGPDD